MAVLSKDWDAAKPSVLVTGGVHGYETSGVQGALLFASTQMAAYGGRFNIAVCPCVNPWGYEGAQRWDSATIAPNRHFIADSPCEPCAAVPGRRGSVPRRASSGSGMPRRASGESKMPRRASEVGIDGRRATA